jgi:hypothetical protein
LRSVEPSDFVDVNDYDCIAFAIFASNGWRDSSSRLSIANRSLADGHNQNLTGYQGNSATESATEMHK